MKYKVGLLLVLTTFLFVSCTKKCYTVSDLSILESRKNITFKTSDDINAITFNRDDIKSIILNKGVLLFTFNNNATINIYLYHPLEYYTFNNNIVRIIIDEATYIFLLRIKEDIY